MSSRTAWFCFAGPFLTAQRRAPGCQLPFLKPVIAEANTCWQPSHEQCSEDLVAAGPEDFLLSPEGATTSIPSATLPSFAPASAPGEELIPSSVLAPAPSPGLPGVLSPVEPPSLEPASFTPTGVPNILFPAGEPSIEPTAFAPDGLEPTLSPMGAFSPQLLAAAGGRCIAAAVR